MAIMSMTAFGAGDSETDSFYYRCEIKTLNSRFIDINVRGPRSLNALESTIIGQIKKSLARGKVEVFFDITAIDDKQHLPRLNESAIGHYIAIDRQVRKLTGTQPAGLTVYELLRMEGSLENVSRAHASDPVALHQEGILQALNQAMEQLLQARATEGAGLLGSFQQLLDVIKQERTAIHSQVETIREHMYDHYKRKLEQFITKLGERGEQISQTLVEERLQTELIVMADKADVAEELTRLESHEQEFARILASGSVVGRKLDFLCQELHREVNTLSNKVSALDVSQRTLNMKEAIERIRQQIQNIE